MNQQCKKKIVESVNNINIHKALVSTHSKPSNAVHDSSVTQLRQKCVVNIDGSSTVKLVHVPFYNTIGYGSSLGMDRHCAWIVTGHGSTLGMDRRWAWIVTGHGSSLGMDRHWPWIDTGHGSSLGMDRHWAWIVIHLPHAMLCSGI